MCFTLTTTLTNLLHPLVAVQYASQINGVPFKGFLNTDEDAITTVIEYSVRTLSYIIINGIFTHSASLSNVFLIIIWKYSRMSGQLQTLYSIHFICT